MFETRFGKDKKTLIIQLEQSIMEKKSSLLSINNILIEFLKLFTII